MTQVHALFLFCSSAQRYLPHRSAQHALLYSGNTIARIIISQLDVSLADCKRYSKKCHITSQSFSGRIKTKPNKPKPHNTSPLQTHSSSKISSVFLMLMWQEWFHSPAVRIYMTLFNVLNNSDLNFPTKVTPQQHMTRSTFQCLQSHLQTLHSRLEGLINLTAHL